MIRRWIIRFVILAVVLVASALALESVLEARDTARYTPGQTFAQVGDARIRYRMLGADHPGATVVILYGTDGSLEQVDQLQTAISSQVPALTYDRAGYGFSQGSHAHNAGEQADELAALLQSLKLEKPVVLVAFSDSNQVARVFAGRYPQKTAAMYLIDPWMPEFDVIYRFGPRSLFVRWVIHELVATSLGYRRLTQRLHSWRGPESPVEQRADAALRRRSHAWALAREWYATNVSLQQTREAPVPPMLPLEVLFPTPIHEDKKTIEILAKLRAGLVARSSRGKLIEVAPIDHSLLIRRGPVFDRIVARIAQLSLANPPS
jgi:pimeloyl-ACP methyl ester carboxylesterase